MTITAQVLIEGAYNRSSANDPGKLAQDPELLLHLNRVYQRLFALMARARPDEMGQEASLVLAGAPPTVALPDDLIDVLGILNAAGNQVHLIPARERFRLWHIPPRVYRVGTSLVSVASVGDPAAGDVLTAQLLGAPAGLVALASPIDGRFPIRHYQLLIDYLAAYLDAKDAGRSGVAHGKLMQELAASVSAFGAEYDLPPAATEWIHAEVERQSAVPK